MKYPTGEIVWTGYYNSSGKLLYIITSKAARDYYYLYENLDGTLKKLGREKDPSALVKRYGVLDRMRSC